MNLFETYFNVFEISIKFCVFKYPYCFLHNNYVWLVLALIAVIVTSTRSIVPYSNLLYRAVQHTLPIL